jgi:hypothetical protein
VPGRNSFGDSDTKANQNIRYLLEINDYDVCGRVIDTAKSACEEKLSIEYGKLCNTAGGRCIELNLLVDSRAAFEETLRIWQQILPSNHPGSK